MSSKTSQLRDLANVDMKSILNQALTDSIGFYVMFMVPMLSGAIIRPQDGELVNSVRLGLYTTTADTVGSMVRNYATSMYNKYEDADSK